MTTNTTQSQQTSEFDEPTRRIEMKKKAAPTAASTPTSSAPAPSLPSTASAGPLPPRKSVQAPFTHVKLGDNVRKAVDQKAVDELALSIKEVGLIQAPVARALGDDHYEIVVGQRRYLAMQKLHAEDPTRFPAMEFIITDATDADLPLVQLAENLGRADMAPYDVCVALTKQANEQNLSAPALAEKVGVGATMVKTYLRIGRAPEFVQSLLLRVENSVRVVGADGAAAVDRHGRPEMKMETLPGLDIKKVERLTKLAETLVSNDKRCAKTPGYKPLAERVVLRLARRCALEAWTVDTLEARCEQALKQPDAEGDVNGAGGADAADAGDANGLVVKKTKLTVDSARASSLEGAARADFVAQLNAFLSPLNLSIKDVSGR